MIRPVAYEGSEPYIFVSYAHKDSDRVLPIVSALQEQGFRVWYDAGIEACSEWPEYIAEHLERCTVFLAFLSQSALRSVHCRQEITFAINKCENLLTVYLEELHLTPGMEMQLGNLQALYRHRHSSQESFLEELCRSRVLAPCLSSIAAPTMPEPLPESTEKEPIPVERIPDEPAPIARTPDLDAIAALFAYEHTEDGGIRINKFTETSIQAVEIPWGVTSIGDYAFFRCTGLTSISIPNSVTSIGEYAFGDCSSLTSISIPNSVTEIGSSAFADCAHLTTIRVDERNPQYCSWNGILFSKDRKELHSFPGGKGGNNAVPYGVTSIGDHAFYGCSGLTSISIPNSVTSIGNHAFFGCSGLTSISIPNSVTSIGGEVFYGCSRLTSISIPNSVTYIGVSAFSWCSSLTSISIPNSVTGIGYRAFYDCSSLESITIPKSVTSIGDYAFAGCSSLESITILNSAASIGWNAFDECYYLTIRSTPDSTAKRYASLCSISFAAL